MQASDDKNPQHLLSVLAHDSLGYFSLIAGMKPTPAVLALQSRPTVKSLREHAKSQWQQLANATRDTIGRSASPLGRLITNLNLNASELALLGIIGETETSTTLVQAIHEMHNQTTHRPSVRLCVDIVRFLTANPDWSPEQLLETRLLREGIVSLDGDGPVPTRALRIELDLWFALKQRNPSIAGIQPLRTGAVTALSAAALYQVAAWAHTIIREQPSIIQIRTIPGSGEATFIQALAEALDLEPMRIDGDTWPINASTQTLTKFSRWLPVIFADRAPPAISNSPMICVVTPPDVILNGAATSVIDLPPLTQEERHALWRENLSNRNIAKRLAETTRIGGERIVQISRNAMALAEARQEPLHGSHIMHARSQRVSQTLAGLAEPQSTYVPDNAYIASEQLRRQAEQWIARCRMRGESWRGLDGTLAEISPTGVRIAVCGQRGSGKTYFSAWLATMLDAPLIRVSDTTLSERRNLQHALRSAAEHDAILLFDCKLDYSIDRLATYGDLINQHSGIVIAEFSSLRNSALDAIQFDIAHTMQPFTKADRSALWRQLLGSRAPRGDFMALLAEHAKLPPAAIRNAVLNAAANSDKKRVQRQDLLVAIRAEFERHSLDYPAELAIIERALPSEPKTPVIDEEIELNSLADASHALPPRFVENHSSSNRYIEAFDLPQHRDGDEEITRFAR